jgi:hypothetical protein
LGRGLYAAHAQRRLNRGLHDDIELLSADEYNERLNTVADHEPAQCEKHAAMTVGELEQAHYFGEEGEFQCNVCRADTLSAAADKLSELNVAKGEGFEMSIRRHLERHWEAFVLLFDPVINM